MVFFMSFSFFQFVAINAVNLGMFEPSAQNRQAAEWMQYRNKVNNEETEKQQRKHPNSEQFLFHYATLKDILG